MKMSQNINILKSQPLSQSSLRMQLQKSRHHQNNIIRKETFLEHSENNEIPRYKIVKCTNSMN